MDRRSLERFFIEFDWMENALVARWKHTPQMMFEKWAEVVLRRLSVRTLHTGLEQRLATPRFDDVLRIEHTSCITFTSQIWLLSENYGSWHPNADKEDLTARVRRDGDDITAAVLEERIIYSRMGGDIAVSLEFYQMTEGLRKAILE